MRPPTPGAAPYERRRRRGERAPCPRVGKDIASGTRRVSRDTCHRNRRRCGGTCQVRLYLRRHLVGQPLASYLPPNPPTTRGTVFGTCENASGPPMKTHGTSLAYESARALSASGVRVFAWVHACRPSARLAASASQALPSTAPSSPDANTQNPSTEEFRTRRGRIDHTEDVRRPERGNPFRSRDRTRRPSAKDALPHMRPSWVALTSAPMADAPPAGESFAPREVACRPKSVPCCPSERCQGDN